MQTPVILSASKFICSSSECPESSLYFDKRVGCSSCQKKIASDIIPFVNGTFALPGDALTNVFANAKLSFTVSFQALQAFLPYTQDIDNMDYTNPLLGTGKPLTIENAIPIFNEAFDYQEVGGDIGEY